MDQGPSTMQRTEGTGPLAPPPGHGGHRSISVQFTGTASEYFRIWVVNTLLTIATLGIYSAWAKVRTKQYFYRNTLIDNVGFDYLADPVAILKGRIIVAVALGLMAWSQYYYMPVYFALLLLLFVATPWVVVKSLAFNARNSAYRNIRFAFPGRVGEAFGVYLKTSLFYLVTCGLGYPWAQWTLTRFIVWRHYYGDLQLTWHAKCSEYYRVYLIAFAMIMPGYAVLIGVMIATMGKGKAPNPVMMTIPMVFFFLYLLIPIAYLRSQLSNLLYGRMMVGMHWFISTQRPVPLLKLYAGNAVAIVASLGLLIPWAKIRLAKYRAETLSVQAVGSLYAESLLTDNTSAIGEGMTDLGDFDLGIGT
jgi:uncharacterized membrane protein YjgN (DUF898 family)